MSVYLLRRNSSRTLRLIAKQMSSALIVCSSLLNIRAVHLAGLENFATPMSVVLPNMTAVRQEVWTHRLCATQVSSESGVKILG